MPSVTYPVYAMIEVWEFSSSKLHHGGDNILEDTVASMNIAVEAFAARSCLFYGDSREKFLELLLVDQDGDLLDKKYDLEQNPIALCGLGLSAYFQTSHFAHDEIYNYGLILVELKIAF